VKGDAGVVGTEEYMKLVGELEAPEAGLVLFRAPQCCLITDGGHLNEELSLRCN
jgi:hypothetical protein